MGLSEKEMDHLLKKLREKYKEHAKKYNPGWFNLEAFEDRFQMALRKRMNLEGFILAEITNFEKIKEQYENNEKKKNDKPFTHQVNRIIEENTEKIRKYKRIQFHNLAGQEISYFYGALAEFALNYFSILWIIVKEADLRHVLHRLEENLSYLAIPRGKKHPKRIEDHALILSRRDIREIEIEKDKNEYLKMSAFLLHEIIEFTKKVQSTTNPQLENPVRFDRLYIEGEDRKAIINNFSNVTGYGAIKKVRDAAFQIINDFRLEAFKKKSSF